MTPFEPKQPAGPLLHICSRTNWRKAQDLGRLKDPSLDSEGFIHCSFVDQVLTPANALFTGQTDLILLVIDRSRLKSRLVIEDSYGSGMEFPHVYGPIELEAVTSTVDFPVNEDGTFSLPKSV